MSAVWLRPGHIEDRAETPRRWLYGPPVGRHFAEERVWVAVAVASQMLQDAMQDRDRQRDTGRCSFCRAVEVLVELVSDSGLRCLSTVV